MFHNGRLVAYDGGGADYTNAGATNPDGIFLVGTYSGTVANSGSMDELRIYDVALTDTEVSNGARFNLWPTVGLQAYYPFDEPFISTYMPSGSVVSDRS